MATMGEAPEAHAETQDTRALVGTAGVSAVELAIAAWLDEKAKRTGSAETARAYRETLASFRQACQSVGLDLDERDGRRLALVVQGWAGRPRGRDGQPVSAVTFNRRIAILSSFYTYAHEQELLDTDNPAARVKRRPTQSYARAVPMEAASVAERLAAIDRTTPAGLRDYALLVVALQTGRRVSELAGLRWGDVARDGERLMVTWQRCKGGKTLRDELPAAVGQALLAWLTAAYGDDLATYTPEMPIWLSLARNRSRGQALGTQSIADICQTRLGSSKVHATRHTFAHTMEALGAKVSDIQARLGHASLQTTSRYLEAMRSAENVHGEALAALYGVTPAPATPASRPPGS